MIWGSAANFFAMGGYGIYVWSSFGVCALVLIIETMLAHKRHRAIIVRLANEHPRESTLPKNVSSPPST